MNQQPVISSRKPCPGMGNRCEEAVRRPVNRVVLALGEMGQTAVLERLFQERGWKVQIASSGAEARALARKCSTAAVLLAEQPACDESGWLTCWKLLRDRPKVKVIIVGTRPAESGSRLAKFVGACGYVPASESAMKIAAALQSGGAV